MSKQTSSNANHQISADENPINQPFTEWRSYESDAPPDEQRSEAPVTNFFQSRKPNATLINSTNAPRLDKRMKKLNKHHCDNATDYRADVDLSSKLDYELKIEVMKTLGTQLDVGWSLIYKGIHRLLSIDAAEMGLPMGAIGFCLYATLYDEATTAYENRTQRRHGEPSPGKERIYWPFREKDANHESFQRVADNLIEFYNNVTESSLQSVLQRLIQGGLPQKANPNRPSNRELLLS